MIRTAALLLGLLLALAPLRAAAQPATTVAKKAARKAAGPEQKYRIDAIIIEGLFFTKPYVVMRELLFDEGDLVTKAEIEASIQRLRNLGIFRIAEYQLLDRRVPLPDGTVPAASEHHRVLRIVVDERWTLIPFGTFSSGGGTFSLTTGLYDINVLGRYIEAGAQYQRFGHTNSFAVWGRDPRFLGQRMGVAGSVAQTNRIHVFYDDAGNLTGGHLRFRQSATIGLEREWKRWFSTGISAAYVKDRYSLQLVPPSIADLEQAHGLPGPEHYLSAGVDGSLGRIDSNSYLRKGLVLTQLFDAANPHLGSSLGFFDSTTELRGFALLPWHINIGARAGVGVTTVQQPEYDFFAGGYSLLRGFRYRRFHGTHMWYANGELRVPSIDTRWLVVQHIAFVDAAGVGGDFGVLHHLSGASAGIGLRVLSPKIFSLIARIDYAWSIAGEGTSALSFGAGQFF